MANEQSPDETWQGEVFEGLRHERRHRSLNIILRHGTHGKEESHTYRGWIKDLMPTHYEVLGLPEAIRDDQELSAQTIRNAYRRALLHNHPDKSRNRNAKAVNFSIDQISGAFSTLSNKKSREEYDRELKQKALEGGAKGKEVFRTGIETVDLDDLETDETQGIWYRDCRCGDERGFLFAEADLEEAAEDGEISVGCRGCSLWLKVIFGVMEQEQGALGKIETHLGEARQRSPRLLSSSS